MVLTPHGNDVLFGKGSAINTHPGNLYFRDLVESYKPTFRQKERTQKKALALNIIREIQNLHPPGRFLMEDPKHKGERISNDGIILYTNHSDVHPIVLSKIWICVENEKAVDKVLHRLREKQRSAENGSGAAVKEHKSPVVQQRQQKVIGVQRSEQQVSSGQKSPPGWVSKHNGINNTFHDVLGAVGPVNSNAGHANIEQNPVPGQTYHSIQPVEAGVQQSYPNTVSFNSLDPSQVASNNDGVSYGSHMNKGEGTFSEKSNYTHTWHEPSQNVKAASVTSEMHQYIAKGDTSTIGHIDNPIHSVSHNDAIKNLCEPTQTASKKSSEELTRPPESSVATGLSNIKDNVLVPKQSVDVGTKTAKEILDKNKDKVTRRVNIEDRGQDKDRMSSLLGINDDSSLDKEIGSFVVEMLSNQDLVENEVLETSGAILDTSEEKVKQRINLQDSGLDREMTSLLVDMFSDQEPADATEEVSITMRQWIGKSKLHGDNPESSEEVLSYIKTALPIAVKLIKFLIDAEEETETENRNDVPLESIAPRNVLVTVKEQPSRDQTKKSDEFIDSVSIVSCLVDSSNTGGTASRLFALGNIFYELFTGEQPNFEDDSFFSNFDAWNLSSDNEETDQPRKKSHSSNNQYLHHRCAASLESKRMPYSICALVGNLFGSNQGDFCSEEAYQSLGDVQQDLFLMLEDPERFLKNIEVGPSPPKLAMPDKLYGRDDEVKRLEDLYQQYIDGHCSGVIIKGGAGVGKSQLAIHTENLTAQTKGYFLRAKFDQSKEDVRPFSTIGSIFNSLCDLFARDANHATIKSVEDELCKALGSQRDFLAGVVPNLGKLMPSCVSPPPNAINSLTSVNSALSMRYLFSELLRVISSKSWGVSMCLDDIQFADTSTLNLIETLIFSTKGTNSVFFIICHRNDEDKESSSFTQWMRSISALSMESIKLENMAPDSVNRFVADTLGLSHRITRPLAAVLYRKTRGNPLFVKQLMVSLKGENCIYFNLSKHRWDWDLNKITELKISDNVLSLVIKDMQKLDSDFQLGLKVAACMGSVTYSVLDILSKDVGVDLQDTLLQVSKRGFLDHISGQCFAFSHDKIQQAALELCTEKEMRQYHMRFGLSICSSAMEASVENNELFFTAIHQINRGGPSVVFASSQKEIIAALNLKAGRKAMNFSDFNGAFSLLQHGISFLGDQHWKNQYKVTLDLYEELCESACVLNKTAWKFYGDELIANARCFDDKLQCLYIKTKGLRHENKFTEFVDTTFEILTQLGEPVPVPWGDDKLVADMRVINNILCDTPDESLLNMKHISKKKTLTLMKLYANLAEGLHFVKPSLVGAVSIRMIRITLQHGLSSVSPIAFCNFGELLTSVGNLSDGCRLGRLALKMMDNINVSSAYKALVTCVVCQTILWASSPLQSIVDQHNHGAKCTSSIPMIKSLEHCSFILTPYPKAGKQSGDFLYSCLNRQLSIATAYIAGQNLAQVEENIQAFILDGKESAPFINISIPLHSQMRVLRKGLRVFDDNNDSGIQDENELFEDAKNKSNANTQLIYHIHRLVRAFLFRQMDEYSLYVNVSEVLSKHKHLMRPLLVLGVFYEGVVTLQLARQATGQTKEMWMQKAASVLKRLELWSEHSSWNWSNKLHLLEAERASILGDIEKAEPFYMSSIRLAREHKFVHEEAVASELFGIFLYEKGHMSKSYSFMSHAIDCYKKWGAFAVAARAETDLRRDFGSNHSQLESRDEVDYILSLNEPSTAGRKRLA